MNYSGYNPLLPQQQQQHSYEYDPSQIQPYDQSYSYQPYYAAYDHQYPYYQQYQPEPSPVYPPGVNPEPIQPRPNHDPIAPSHFRGRGGRSFRRGGRGRGRGVGGGRHLPSPSSAPAISDALGAPAAAGAPLVAQSSSSVSGQTTLPKPVQPPPRGVYCEICKIECNSPEIMEMHKNGKKHQKNMKVHEMMQKNNAVNGLQSGQIPTPQLNSTDQPNKVQESEDKICPTKNISSEISADNHKDEIKLQNNVGDTSKVAAEEHDGITMENAAARGHGLKRKMKGGKGRKSKRTADGSKEVSRAEQAIAFTCEVCNVKCDSHVVYQSHLTGKKHLKRVHGHQALSAVGNGDSSGVNHQALSGAVGLQAVYPPDINALANAINAQVQQGDNDPQVLLAQLLVNVLSQAQGSATAPLNGSLAAQTPTPTPAAGSSYEPQIAETQVSEIPAHVGMENSGGELKQLLVNVLSQAQGSATAPLNGSLATQTPTPTPAAGSSYEPQIAQTQVSDIPAAHVGMENSGGELKGEMSSVPLESNALEGSSVSTQIEGGSSEAK